MHDGWLVINDRADRDGQPFGRTSPAHMPIYITPIPQLRPNPAPSPSHPSLHSIGGGR